jgi:hypothetical protein
MSLLDILDCQNNWNPNYISNNSNVNCVLRIIPNLSVRKIIIWFNCIQENSRLKINFKIIELLYFIPSYLNLVHKQSYIRYSATQACGIEKIILKEIIKITGCHLVFNDFPDIQTNMNGSTLGAKLTPLARNVSRKIFWLTLFRNKIILLKCNNFKDFIINIIAIINKLKRNLILVWLVLSWQSIGLNQFIFSRLFQLWIWSLLSASSEMSTISFE